MPDWLAELLSVADAALHAPGRSPDVTASTFATATTPRGVLARATAALAGGDATAAQRAASALVRRTDLPLDVRVDGWLLVATCELVHGRTDQARRALERAVNLAEPERLRRPVLEAPARLRRFLRHERFIAGRHDWLAATVETAEPAGTADAGPAAVVIEPLTARETEVLGYLAALFSTEEIARKMFVSVNTVKTHVRGVLRKLAASRRNEAVRRARELGLI
jgi:LuxR family maltose regulon positive regulatory protein